MTPDREISLMLQDEANTHYAQSLRELDSLFSKSLFLGGERSLLSAEFGDAYLDVLSDSYRFAAQATRDHMVNVDAFYPEPVRTPDWHIPNPSYDSLFGLFVGASPGLASGNATLGVIGGSLGFFLGSSVAAYHKNRSGSTFVESLIEQYECSAASKRLVSGARGFRDEGSGFVEISDVLLDDVASPSARPVHHIREVNASLKRVLGSGLYLGAPGFDSYRSKISGYQGAVDIL